MTDPIPPRPTAGHIIEADSFSSKFGCAWWIVGGIGAAFLFAMVRGWAGVILALLAIAIFVGFFWSNISAMFGWKPAELEVDYLPLMLGSTPEVTFRRRPRRASKIPSCTVDCKLVCEERATYRQGSRTRTDTATLVERTFSGQGTATADGLEANVRIEIPARLGAPTFDLGDNEVRWQLEATIRGDGLPDDEQRFTLVVGPTLDPIQRNELGD